MKLFASVKASKVRGIRRIVETTSSWMEKLDRAAGGLDKNVMLNACFGGRPCSPPSVLAKMPANFD